MNLISTDSGIKREEGFTLIEVLIALALLSFMMVGIYTVTDNSINTKDTVIKEDREFLQLYTFTHRLHQDISQMYSPLYFSSTEIKRVNNGQQGQNRGYSDNPAANNHFIPSRMFPQVTVKNQPVPIVEQESKSDLTFMTGSNKRFIEGQKQSPYAWVKYSLESDEEPIAEGTSQIVRRINNTGVWLGDNTIDEYKPYTLLRGVKEFFFEFWSRRDEKWVENLQLLPPEERFAIRAVRITLTFIDSSGVERTSLRVFRPFWPYFDVVKDETERQSVNNTPNPNANNNQNNNQGGGR
ncbi:MAG: prepilin-type N-terminal cleavage/methylation domain-containing protein [Halobacteriovoraceae bacterium]|nr:prepilin-type N-terminal cleavage/methylation domain-containing protein [Halobacteriovoraceae bacterium]